MEDTLADPARADGHYAVCIDSRSQHLDTFGDFAGSIDRQRIDFQIIFLDALTGTLVKRFSETRRRHPLTNDHTDLLQAIESEASVLRQIVDLADLSIDTTLMRGSELVELIRSRIAQNNDHGISILFRSFGFKFGVPVDADLVFDLRCLPNPYWQPELRSHTGLDEPVIRFLQTQASVDEMYQDIATFLDRWIPRFEEDNRAYITIAIGCTGGQHRSVYMVEKLGKHFLGKKSSVLVRHRELRG